MACSGVGITMLGVVALIALVRRGWRVALAIAALPAIAYAWWYLAYGSQSPDVTTLSYRTVPGFVWDGLTDALGDLVRLRAMGVVIVLAVFAWLVCQLLHRPFPRALLVPAVLALGAVVSLALTGWRRGNITEPSLSRYAYITIVLVLPLVAAAADWLVRRLARERFARVVPVVTAVLLLLIVIAQVRIFDNYVGSIEEAKRVEKAAFLTTAVLVREGHLLLNDHPMFIYEPQVTAAKIAALDRDGKLPSLTGLRLGDRYTVLARLDLVVAPDHLSGYSPTPRPPASARSRRADRTGRRSARLRRARIVEAGRHRAAPDRREGRGRSVRRRPTRAARRAPRWQRAGRGCRRDPRSEGRAGLEHRPDRSGRGRAHASEGHDPRVR
jgi:hypothetical protein